MAWGVAESWDAAVEVTAARYRLTPEVLRAESRGRGPRPPKNAFEAKKLAVYLTVVLSDRTYAEISRAIGLHKDTVASHCDSIRQATDDDEFEALVDSVQALCVARLNVSPVAPPASFDDPSASIKSLLIALGGRVGRVERLLERLLELHPSMTDERGPSSVNDAPAQIIFENNFDDGKVISLPRVRK